MKIDSRCDGRQKWMAAILIYALLSLAGCLSDGGSKMTGTTPLTDITWQWIETLETTGEASITVAHPEKYSIVFKTDGTFHGKADCNVMGGRYTYAEGFQIAPGPSTMAYCSEQSLDRKYLDGLGRTTAGRIDERGYLILESTGSTTRMRFRNGGDAP